MRNTLRDAALAYAERGWPIFPARQDKTPYIEGGVTKATTDPEQIEAWWEKFPTANVALDVGGAGMMVLDLDPGHDWEELEKNIGDIPDTRLVSQTPRGGEHLFFALEGDEIVSPSASKIAKKVDVRSFHSYVLLPPSSTADGGYKWESKSTAKPAFRTDEMVRAANSYRERSEDHDTWLIEPDLPENVADAIDWLENKAKIAVEGEGGDHTAYATGAYMKSFGISEDKAFELIWEHWNPRCDPPWDEAEEDHLRAKVEHAYRYNTSPPGNVTDAYQQAKLRQDFEPIQNKKSKGFDKQGMFRVLDWNSLDNLPALEWLIKDTLHVESFSVIYGQSEVFKSFTALDMALCIASDPKKKGDKRRRKPKRNWEPKYHGKVLYVAGESPASFQLRTRAWAKQYNNGEPVDNFRLVTPSPLAVEEKQWKIFLDETLAAIGDDEIYELIVIDTFQMALQGGDENNSKDMGLFIAMVKMLIKETGAAVLVVHHENQQGAMRGSGILRGAIDTQIRAEREGTLQTLSMRSPEGKQRNAQAWAVDKHFTAKTLMLGGPQETSVVMVPAEIEEIEEAEEMKEQTVTSALGKRKKPNPKRKASKGFDPVKNEFGAKLMDDLIVEILREHPAKQWTNKALAEAIAMDERCDYPSTHLTRSRGSLTLHALREDKKRRANKLYDPSTRKWRWKKGMPVN